MASPRSGPEHSCPPLQLRTMDTAGWSELCHDALGVARNLPEDERRQLAAQALLEMSEEPVDILGMGAAEAAIDLVVRYGAAGDLSEVLLRWEEAENVPPGLLEFGDDGLRKATVLAQRLLRDVIAYAERSPDARIPSE